VSLARRLTLGLWAGMLISVGAIVAPLLFATLEDRHLAGALAGRLFRVVACVSLAAALLVALVQPATVAGGLRRRLVPLLLAGLLLLATFALHARAGGEGAAFPLWHGLATGLYVLATAGVFALWLADERRTPR
jgi:hypothetical protein